MLDKMNTIKYLELRKQVNKKVEGCYEYITNHVVKIYEKELYEILIDSIENKYDDDYEYAYDAGIVYSWDDLFSVDISKYIGALKERIQDDIEDYDYEEDDKHIIDLRKLLKFLEEYKDYQLYFEEEKEVDSKDVNNPNFEVAEDQMGAVEDASVGCSKPHLSHVEKSNSLVAPEVESSSSSHGDNICSKCKHKEETHGKRGCHFPLCECKKFVLEEASSK